MKIIFGTQNLYSSFQNIFSQNKTVIVVVIVFICLRALSFFTYHIPSLNHSIAAFFILLYFFICKKNLSLGWIILLFELFLDGSGHFFEFEHFILRTWILGIFGSLWIWSKIHDKKITLPASKIQRRLLVGTLVGIVLSTLNGFIHHHAPINILQDAILYFFLLLTFPALEFETLKSIHFFTLLKSFLIGSALFSFITFCIYSSGLGTLPDSYYHWYRNIAGGKITDLGNHFFRIVTSEHLFIVPVILILASMLSEQKKNKKLWIYMALALFVLILNFSRIYFVGLFLGFFILLFKNSFKQWFFVSVCTTILFISLFAVTSFVSSRGNSFGLELFGIKMNGTVTPNSDVSGAIRLAILPDAIASIKAHPWFGSGLAATVTYIDPVTKLSVTRTQFDWGYLEVLAELGIVGTTLFLLFLFSILFSLLKLLKTKNMSQTHVAFLRGIFAGAISLFIFNLTMPALFHGFGVLYFVFLLVVIQKR